MEIEDDNSICWYSGINTVPVAKFTTLTLINWCKWLNINKIFIVSHDGTITYYRPFLGEIVTRDNFLGDVGYHKIIV
ncbi:hypothetical protein J6TS2_21740 [Heyndrickxia sporothermodurans]|nr:hypothetical protein J6TS2_21740 [Heyndrickxia sporothermodurans]